MTGIEPATFGVTDQYSNLPSPIPGLFLLCSWRQSKQIRGAPAGRLRGSGAPVRESRRVANGAVLFEKHPKSLYYVQVPVNCEGGAPPFGGLLALTRSNT